MSSSLIYGIHAVSSRIQQAPNQCRHLYHLDKPNARLSAVIEQARTARLGLEPMSRSQLSELCGNEKHQGCVLETVDLTTGLDFSQCLAAIDASSLLLVLDGVQDPHNLGACLRTADACGVSAVIIPRDRAVKMNATVRKVAAGGADTVPLIEVTNIARCLKELKQAGVWVYGTSDRAGETIYQHDFSGPVALVMGGEGSGLRRLTAESCDHLVSLPMQGRVESLNVSVATGVCLYEILRSRESK